MKPLWQVPVRNKNAREQHFRKQEREFELKQLKYKKQQREERKLKQPK
jgi:hypothetical protein